MATSAAILFALGLIGLCFALLVVKSIYLEADHVCYAIIGA